MRMEERRGKGGDRGREEGQQGALGKPMGAGLRRTPPPLTPEDQGERWAHLEGRWLGGHLPMAADFSLKEEEELLRLRRLRADETGCCFRGEGRPCLQSLSCTTLFCCWLLAFFSVRSF